MSPELYNLARNISWGIVLRRFPWMNQAQMEDLAQAGVIRAWEAGATKDHDIAFAARAGVIDEFRKLYGRRPDKQAFNLGRVSLADVEYKLSSEDDYQVDAEAVLSMLPKRERAIVVRRVQGYPMAEIGREFGVSESRISQLLDRSRRRIRHARALAA